MRAAIGCDKGWVQYARKEDCEHAAVARTIVAIYLGLAAGQIAALVHVMLADAVEDALHLGHLGHLRPTLSLRHVASGNCNCWAWRFFVAHGLLTLVSSESPA